MGEIEYCTRDEDNKTLKLNSVNLIGIYEWIISGMSRVCVEWKIISVCDVFEISDKNIFQTHHTHLLLFRRFDLKYVTELFTVQGVAISTCHWRSTEHSVFERIFVVFRIHIQNLLGQTEMRTREGKE